MKNSLLAVAALAVAALVFVWWSSDSADFAIDSDPGAQPTSAPAAEAEELAGSESLAQSGEAQAGEPNSREIAAPAAGAQNASAPTTAQEPGDRFAWLGRVTDSDGRPLEGVRIGLGSATFRPGRTSPDELLRAFANDPQAITDAEGRFRFEGEVRDMHWRILWALPEGPGHLTLIEHCADGATANAPWRASPVPGVTELEDVVLRSAGWLTGRVVDEIGQPLEGAFVKVGQENSFYENVMLGCTSGPDGSFALGHLPAGDFPVTALLEGRVNASLEGVRVTLGRGADVGDLAMVPALPMEGRILDPDGAPIAGARVRAWGETTPSFGETESGDDGTFLVFVDAREPHRFEISAKGFRPYGAGGSGEPFEPGGPQAEVVLEPEVKVTFEVLNAKTREPLERFGLTVLEGMGSANTGRTMITMSTPSERDRPGGAVVEAAVPEFDRVVVRATGYDGFRGDVVLDAGTSDRMTIALDPLFDEPWAVFGRVAGADEGAPFRLAKLRRPRSTWGFDAEQRASNLAERFGWTLDSNGRLDSTIAAEGRFRINNPGSGDYRLFCDLGDACASSAPVRVASGEDTDLGELPVVEWATLSGRVRAPSGTDPSTLTLYLHGQDRVVHPDSSGRFTVERLYPGEEYLSVASLSGALVAPFPKFLQLFPGNANQVSWDLSDAAATTVQLEVRVNGELAPQSQLRLSPADGFGPANRAGTTDEAGRLTCDVPAAGGLTASLLLFDRTWSEPAAAKVQPVADLQVLDFPLTELSIRLPGDLVLGEFENVSARLFEGDAREIHNPFAKVETAPNGERFARLGALESGVFRLELEVTRPSSSGGGGDSLFGQPPPEAVEGTSAVFELEITAPGELILDWVDGLP